MLLSVRHDWPEKAGFLISRPSGLDSYTFIHFLTPVRLRTQGAEISVRAGGCIFFAPDTPQFFQSDSDVIHNWAHFDKRLSEKLTLYNIPTDQILYPKDVGFISDIFRKLEIENFSENEHKDTLCAALSEEFLIRFSRALHGETPLPLTDRAERKRLRELRQYILSHPEQKWSVSKIADKVPLSPSRFHAVYKSLFGTSPMQDVIEAKISYAKSLLLANHRLSLPEVAEKLGYNDQYHFIRQFKAVTGETPGQYRKSRR